MFEPSFYWVEGIAPHRLALMPHPRGGEWLAEEIAAWRRAGIGVVVSLLESHEVRELALGEEASLCAANGIRFRSFPIADRSTPASACEFSGLLLDLRAHLLRGAAIAIHCRAGIGRAGLAAGCLLHLLHVPHDEIFPLLSRSRGVAVPDTEEQALWLGRYARSQGISLPRQA